MTDKKKKKGFTIKWWWDSSDEERAKEDPEYARTLQEADKLIASQDMTKDEIQENKKEIITEAIENEESIQDEKKESIIDKWFGHSENSNDEKEVDPVESGNRSDDDSGMNQNNETESKVIGDDEGFKYDDKNKRENQEGMNNRDNTSNHPVDENDNKNSHKDMDNPVNSNNNENSPHKDVDNPANSNNNENSPHKDVDNPANSNNNTSQISNYNHNQRNLNDAPEDNSYNKQEKQSQIKDSVNIDTTTVNDNENANLSKNRHFNEDENKKDGQAYQNATSDHNNNTNGDKVSNNKGFWSFGDSTITNKDDIGKNNEDTGKKDFNDETGKNMRNDNKNAHSNGEYNLKTNDTENRASDAFADKRSTFPNETSENNSREEIYPGKTPPTEVTKPNPESLRRSNQEGQNLKYEENKSVKYQDKRVEDKGSANEHENKESDREANENKKADQYRSIAIYLGAFNIILVLLFLFYTEIYTDGTVTFNTIGLIFLISSIFPFLLIAFPINITIPVLSAFSTFFLICVLIYLYLNRVKVLFYQIDFTSLNESAQASLATLADEKIGVFEKLKKVEDVLSQIEENKFADEIEIKDTDEIKILILTYDFNQIETIVQQDFDYNSETAASIIKGALNSSSKRQSQSITAGGSLYYGWKYDKSVKILKEISKTYFSRMGRNYRYLIGFFDRDTNFNSVFRATVRRVL